LIKQENAIIIGMRVGGYERDDIEKVTRQKIRKTIKFANSKLGRTKQGKKLEALGNCEILVSLRKVSSTLMRAG
jgi:hypothetical protein